MRVEIARHALDRIPLSIIFDDSTLLVNLNYFFMRDRNLVDRCFESVDLELRWFADAADLPHVLERGGLDQFILRQFGISPQLFDTPAMGHLRPAPADDLVADLENRVQRNHPVERIPRDAH